MGLVSTQPPKDRDPDSNQIFDLQFLASAHPRPSELTLDKFRVIFPLLLQEGLMPVSYTHLDVYKRQWLPFSRYSLHNLL